MSSYIQRCGHAICGCLRWSCCHIADKICTVVTGVALFCFTLFVIWLFAYYYGRGVIHWLTMPKSPMLVCDTGFTLRGGICIDDNSTWAIPYEATPSPFEDY
jgi:hypothetical protein